MESNNSNNFVSTSANDSSNENASFVTITTVNQMMPPVALYSTEIPQPNVGMLQDYSMINYNQNMINNNNHYLAYAQPNATPTPVVKSHHNHTTPMYSSPPNGYNTHQTGFLPMVDTSLATTNMMNNSSAMDIDDYYQSSNIESMIMMDTMSPSSPTHMRSPNAMMSPIQDTYTSPTATPYQHLLVNDATIETMYPEGMIVPTNIGMSHFNNNNNNNGMLYHDDMMLHHQQSFQPQQQPTTFFDRKGRRPLPRRHTVSTPYASNMNKGKEPDVKTNELVTSQPVLTKSRKSSLKAKRHRSLGKLDIFATSHSSPPPVPDMATFEPLSANLELWTHEQLLERVMELEKEKEAVVQTTTKFNEVTQTDGGEPKSSYNNNNSSKTIINKIRSASQTDTELDEEEEEEDDIQVCKWDTCTLELNSLDDLINHVKVDHIGSGKANYYCSWRDCIRQQKPFTKRHKMHNHLRTHTGERPFVCLEPDCGKRFSRPDSLTTHVKIHSNIRPHLCKNPNCGKAYYHLRSLRKHERSHIQKSDIPPLPSAAAAAVVAHTAQPDNSIGVAQEGDVYSEWGLSAQAAVFNVLDRETPSYI